MAEAQPLSGESLQTKGAVKTDPELRALIRERLRAIELAHYKLERAMDVVRYHSRVLRGLLDENQDQTDRFVDRYARLTRRWRRL